METWQLALRARCHVSIRLSPSLCNAILNTCPCLLAIVFICFHWTLPLEWNIYIYIISMSIYIHFEIWLCYLWSMIHSMGWASPGFVVHGLLMCLCGVGQYQIGHIFFHHSSHIRTTSFQDFLARWCRESLSLGQVWYRTWHTRYVHLCCGLQKTVVISFMTTFYKISADLGQEHPPSNQFWYWGSVFKQSLKGHWPALLRALFHEPKPFVYGIVGPAITLHGSYYTGTAMGWIHLIWSNASKVLWPTGRFYWEPSSTTPRLSFMA